MDNNMYNGAAAPQPQGGQQKNGLGGSKMDVKMIGIIAAVVVVFLVILIAGIAGSGTSKAKKAVKTHIQVFMSGDKKDSDVKWTKYYPKELEREVEDWAEAVYKGSKSSFEDVEHIKFLSVATLKGKDMVRILDDLVEDFYLSGGFDLDKSDVKGLKVSKGYLLTVQMEYDGDLCVYEFLVIKVDGRYGVYDRWENLSE